ncbi:MAG: hypothetical protein CEE43_12295 [Promethearchaeota archaeon Loki_b32]|nr:MAG: hypothetical protein CEE43_12295 [Candidatus Lokiarchaeota archaeon Loki_b32]
MKDLKCLKCGKIYDPVLRIKDSKVFCRNCEFLRIKKDLGPFEGLFSIGEKGDKLKLLKAIEEIQNTVPFFFHLLSYQDQISEELFNLGFYSVEHIKRWVYSQYLLEIIFTDKLSNHRFKDLKYDQDYKENFAPKREKLFFLAEKAYSYDRYFKDLQNDKIAHLDDGSRIELYLTKEKFFFATPKDIYEIIIRKNPFYYDEYIMDCKGYSPNILINIDSTMQEWSLSAKIFTDIAKYTSIYPININHLKNPEISAQILRTHATDHIMNLISPSFPIIIIYYDDHDNFLDYLRKFVSFGFFLRGISSSEDNFQDRFKETFYYFSTQFNFRRIFYSLKDCYITTSSRLNFFSKILESQYQIFKKNKKREIRVYRGIKNLEKSIWKLGFHLDVDLIFNSKRVMRNLKVKCPEGEFEVDVVFHNKGKLEFIECKSDVALNLVRQEEYFRKMRNKINPLKNFFESRGYEIKHITPSMICQICVTPPPSDIDIYLSEIHLFEVLTRRNGLFEWDGMGFFDKYPIIARIGWENYIYSDNLNINLDHLLLHSNLFLRPTKIDELTNDYDFEINDSSKWESLNILCIYNKTEKKIIDFIFLPPYYRQNYNDFYTWDEALAFHTSIYGQRFLHIASKNGIFGFCPECMIYPLVPTGYAYKPARFSAKGVCPNCNKSIDIEAFDRASFHKNEDLLKKVQLSFNKRLL